MEAFPRLSECLATGGETEWAGGRLQLPEKQAMRAVRERKEGKGNGARDQTEFSARRGDKREAGSAECPSDLNRVLGRIGRGPIN